MRISGISLRALPQRLLDLDLDLWRFEEGKQVSVAFQVYGHILGFVGSVTFSPQSELHSSVRPSAWI